MAPRSCRRAASKFIYYCQRNDAELVLFTSPQASNQTKVVRPLRSKSSQKCSHLKLRWTEVDLQYTSICGLSDCHDIHQPLNIWDTYALVAIALLWVRVPAHKHHCGVLNAHSR